MRGTQNAELESGTQAFWPKINADVARSRSNSVSADGSLRELI